MTIIYALPEPLPDPRARFIQIINTCYALANTGIEVMLITGIKKRYSIEEIFKFYNIKKHPNLKIIRLPILRRENSKYFRFSWHGVFYFSLLSLLFFRKLLAENKTVLFIRHLKLADFLLRFRKILCIPVIFEVHEIFYFNVLKGRKREKTMEIEYRVYNKADSMISISESINKHLIQMQILQKIIHIIPDGVKKDWLDIDKNPSASYICYTGSLYLWKGIDTLISAMKFLPDEKLLIVGGGGRLVKLKKIAKDEGVASRIEFIGAVPHSSIPDYLSQAKVAVLPNISHGPSQFSSPLKLFEYMACGIPIVASDIPVFREILTDGRNAILFEPDNPESLANSIKRIVDTPELAAKLVSNAKKEAGSYTYERRAEKILDVIKDI